MKPDDWKMLADKLGYVSSVAHFEPGAVTKGAKLGYVVFIDELNKFTPAALTDLTQFLSGQSIQLENGEWISMKSAHPNFRLAFAMNQAGPLHPDREPLVRELMSRLSRNMMIIHELDRNQEKQFLLFQWLGEQPTIKLPDNRTFTAKAFEPAPVFKTLVQAQQTKVLKEFADKYVKARAISRETSRKMETGEDCIVPREHTTETWPFDRRDLISFSNDVLEILEVATSMPMVKSMFDKTIQRHCTQHFQIYNLEKGSNVMTEFVDNVRQLELFSTFENMVQTLVNVYTIESGKEDPAGLEKSTRELAKQMGQFTPIAVGDPKGVGKSITLVKIPKDENHPFRVDNKSGIINAAKVVEGLMLSSGKVTSANLSAVQKVLKNNYPIKVVAFDKPLDAEGFANKFPEFKGLITPQETGAFVMSDFLKEQLMSVAAPAIAHDTNQIS